MHEPNPLVDAFLDSGCGRCERGGTPDCKVHQWPEVLRNLRAILLQTQLTESLKWGFPCYTWQEKNVLLLSAFNERCTISFLQGVLIQDRHQVLELPGENTQSARIIAFTNVAQIAPMEAIIREYVDQAIQLVEQDAKVTFKSRPEPRPETLVHCLEKDPELNTAFEALTPGRQRSYILHIGAAKQSSTQRSRIAKCRNKILAGKGFNERD